MTALADKDIDTLVKLCPKNDDVAIAEEFLSGIGSGEKKYKFGTIESIDKDEKDVEVYNNNSDLKGKVSAIKEVIIPENMGWNWKYHSLVDNICLIEEYPNRLITYNLTTSEFYMLPEKYSSILMIDDIEENLEFKDGCIALPLKGRDGKKYVAMFDTKWNVVLEPIIATKYSPISDNRIVIKTILDDGKVTDIVYDTQGNNIFNGSDKNYNAIYSYSDGAARIASTIPTYIDTSGNILFDIIDMSNFS